MVWECTKHFHISVDLEEFLQVYFKKVEIHMTKIERLRNELHKQIDTGNYKEILTISKKLDEEILKVLKRDLNNTHVHNLHR